MSFSDIETDEGKLRQCKRCLLLQSNDTENFRLVREHIDRINEQDRCDKDTYNNRLNICTSCDELVSGTCLKCGCYVEFRAAFKRNKCPIKKW